MKKLILIGGDFASGKSTYSQHLGKALGITVINKDMLKEILGDNFDTKNREENLKLSVCAFDLICQAIKSSANNLIIESNFKPYELPKIEELAHAYGYDVLSLRLTGDDSVLHQRFQARLEQNRHPVHKAQDFTNLSDFTDALNILRSAKYIGKVIEVNSTIFDYATDQTLLNQIKNFLN